MPAPIVSNDAAPAVSAVAITPSDSADFTTTSCRAIWVGGTGTIKVDMSDGTTVTFSGVPAGYILPIRARRVYSTGTTATLMLVLY